MKYFTLNRISACLLITTCGALNIGVAHAQSTQQDTEIISVIGRSAVPRTVTESPVAVDVVSAEEFNAVGNAGDVTDNLKALIPSYTATPATGDGSAFVRPTSLRGMSPDQTLVLINGKRRHRSALVQFFAPAAGNGSHGPDVGMIPGIAIKNVEVLRDGAAAQYGSDAIAGVINFNIKDDSEGGEALVQYGQHKEGEQSVKVAVNKGLALGDRGFINISAEHTDYEALSRGNKRPDAEALRESGVNGVGADSPFNDGLAQTWGRPETSGTKLFVNTGYEFSDAVQWYLQGNYAQTEGRYRFFYRNPSHGSLKTLKLEPTYSASNPAKVFLTGYTPYLDGEQEDQSVVTGFKGDITDNTNYDISIGFGENDLDYHLYNTTNPQLGLNSSGEPLQRDFDVGGFKQEEKSFNIDLSTILTDNIYFSYGAEWREETYTVIAGEKNSYSGSGSNGLPGNRAITPNVFERDNYGVYAELEHDVTDAFLMQYAVRYEDYSDFGGTANGKVAGRYIVKDGLTLRASYSTGFHAPTPGQANVTTTTTTFGSDGQQEDTVLLPSTSKLATAYGGLPLKEEQSKSATMGFSTELAEDVNFTVDVYNTTVDDRIYRTQKIDVSSDPEAIKVNIKKLSFYTNALDMRHRGIDVVTTAKLGEVNLTFAYNYNEAKVMDQSSVFKKDNTGNSVAVKPVVDSLVEDIENNYPKSRFVLSARSDLTDDLSWSTRATYYGEHYDERGTIAGTEITAIEDNKVITAIKNGSRSKLISPTVYVDVELAYALTDDLTLHLGGANIFDEYVDTIEDPYANRNSVGLPYPRRSPANYEGASWYLKARYMF